jgi:membrane protease YdiL (CAAX protease family)
MLEAFSKVQRRRTLLLLVVCGVLAAAAGAVGMDDNSVGGSLAWLSAIALVLAFAHPWRTSRRFLLLTGASVLAFVALVVVGGVIDNAGVDVGGIAFLLAIFLCPAGLVVGIIGAVVTLVASRRAHHVPPGRPVT